MPDFFQNNHLFHNPVEFVLKRIGGAYKMPILWRLKDKNLRFSELQKSLPHISDRMLSKSLKELVADGFIIKKDSKKNSVRTEYELSKRGRKSIHIIELLRKYGTELMNEENIIIVTG